MNCGEEIFEFFYSFLPNPASIDIQWVATIECQYWQDSARIGQKTK